VYRPTNPQSSLFEPIRLFPGILPDDDWSFTFRDQVLPLIDENLFKHFYEEQHGAPNKSIRTQVSLLIFMALEKLTWRQAEFMLQRRIDWMNATCTDFGKACIDHTTLFKFFQKLTEDDTAYQFFVELTAHFVQVCGVSTKKQRVDSFFMLGWLATLSRYGLFKETLRVFLQALRKHYPQHYEQIQPELSQDYLQDAFDLTEKDPEKTHRRITEMARDLYRVKMAFEQHAKIKWFTTFQTLVTVFEQQCEEKPRTTDSDQPASKSDSGKSSKKNAQDHQEIGVDSASESEILIREKPLGDKIISTPHNTDAEYTRKRAQKVVGHKGFVTETCDPDNAIQLITDVQVEKATYADATELPEILSRLEAQQMKPDELFADAGFVNGKTIIESERRAVDLAGPSSGRAQDFTAFRKEDRPYDLADFEVSFTVESEKLEVLSCPAKHKPLDQKRSDKTGRILVHFERATCAQCPTKDRCPIKIGVQVATMDVSEQQYVGAQRHHLYMGDAEYRKRCGTRAGAESVVNEVANGHGARKSKHKTELRTRLQLLFAGIGCNVKRYLRYRDRCAQIERAMVGST